METTSSKQAAPDPTFCQRLLSTALLPSATVLTAHAQVGDDPEALANYFVREGLLTPFQIRQLRAGASGFYVDKYIVLDCLGRGGSGIVFKARHTLPPHRLVALKTLDMRNLHKSDELLARFRREIDIIIRLQHPNIVRAYEVIRTRTQIFLVMEYVDGSDLATVIRRRGRLPVAEAVGYGLQAAKALSYAHRCGVIHRDLKPGNLLLTRDGQVKLSDLGLARDDNDEAEASLTMKGACLGTPEFMAPEQAEDAARADVRSDLYTLGTTLFFLITAELPVTGGSYVQRLQRLLTLPARPLADARPEVPDQLARIVDRLRARNPAERPASAEEAITLLGPFAARLESPPALWDAARKSALVLEVLQGSLTAEAACERHLLEAAELERWRLRFLEAGKRGLGENQEMPAGQVHNLQAHIASQAREIERLKKLLEAAEER